MEQLGVNAGPYGTNAQNENVMESTAGNAQNPGPESTQISFPD